MGTPFAPALPESAADVAPEASLSFQNPVGLSASTDDVYESIFDEPETGIVPADALLPVGADAKFPAVLPPAMPMTVVGVPVPEAFVAYTRYMYCVPATRDPIAYGEVAEVLTFVHTAPSVDDCRTKPVNALVPVSLGVFQVNVRPPIVAVAMSASTRPGTPPVA